MTQFRFLHTAFLLYLAVPLTAQTAETRQTEGGTPASSAMLPSTVLHPALTNLRQALSMLRPEKWKAPSEINAESASDIGSIQRDLDHTLPPLLNVSDASPNSVQQLLPAYRNIEALYDVLVRVTQTSILAAPSQQSAALQQATQSLQQARRDFGDMLDSAAQSQDRRFHDVQTRLTALQAAPPPVAPVPVCAPPPPAKKTKPRAKKSTKPATSSTSSTSH